MLIQALTQQFQSYFDSADGHTTVLWFDPDREYEALLPHLAGAALWRYDGSLLRLRYRLIQRSAGEKTVVYLPMRQEDAEVLRPFFATSLLFTDRLYKFLRRQGLDFPDDPQVAHELRALLPRLAARSVGKGREFWTYNLANLARARETLIGSFDDALLRFLAGPAAESLIGALEERTFCGAEYRSGLVYGPHVVGGRYFWMGALSAAGGASSAGTPAAASQKAGRLMQSLSGRCSALWGANTCRRRRSASAPTRNPDWVPSSPCRSASTA